MASATAALPGRAGPFDTSDGAPGPSPLELAPQWTIVALALDRADARTRSPLEPTRLPKARGSPAYVRLRLPAASHSGRMTDPNAAPRSRRPPPPLSDAGDSIGAQFRPP